MYRGVGCPAYTVINGSLGDFYMRGNGAAEGDTGQAGSCHYLFAITCFFLTKGEDDQNNPTQACCRSLSNVLD